MTTSILVTGAEKNYFVSGCMLMWSLKLWAPELPFYFLDFGLEEGQRNFLRGQGALIERPAELAADLHPFAYKAAMGEYLRGIDWSEMVWLDSDMIAVAPLGEKLATVLTEMAGNGKEVASCRDVSPSLAAFIAQGWEVNPFVDALRSDKVDLSGPYYNTGAVVCRSPEFLAAWRDLAKAIPFHVLFEQNAFNLLVRRRTGVTTLAMNEWNLHGPSLRECNSAKDGQGRNIIKTPSGTAMIVHATSHDSADIDIRNAVAGMKTGGIPCVIKLFRNPALLDLQKMWLTRFLTEAENDLHKAGAVNSPQSN